MSGPLGLGWLMWAASAAAIAGVLVLVFRAMGVRFDADASVARALLVTGVALAASDFAFGQDTPWLWWVSGFAVCAALHRWFDAATPSPPTLTAPASSLSSKSNRKPKA